jgi:hypothetical protein
MAQFSDRISTNFPATRSESVQRHLVGMPLNPDQKVGATVHHPRLNRTPRMSRNTIDSLKLEELVSDMGAVRGASAGKRATIPYFPPNYDDKAGLGLIAHLATVPPRARAGPPHR